MWDLVTWSKDRSLRMWALSDELRQTLSAVPQDDDIGEDMIDPTFDISGVAMESSLTMEMEAIESSSTLDSSPMVTRSLREGSLAGSLSRSSPIKSVGSFHQTGSPSSLTRTSSAGHQVFQPQTTHTLAQEFSLLNLDNVSHLEIETVSVCVYYTYCEVCYMY